MTDMQTLICNCGTELHCFVHNPIFKEGDYILMTNRRKLMPKFRAYELKPIEDIEVLTFKLLKRLGGPIRDLPEYPTFDECIRFFLLKEDFAVAMEKAGTRFLKQTKIYKVDEPHLITKGGARLFCPICETCWTDPVRCDFVPNDSPLRKSWEEELLNDSVKRYWICPMCGNAIDRLNDEKEKLCQKM